MKSMIWMLQPVGLDRFRYSLRKPCLLLCASRMPPAAGQYLIGETKPSAERRGGVAAMLLWARVSPEVDKRLSESKDKPPRLKPDAIKLLLESTSNTVKVKNKDETTG
jgi:hypothetical protein